MDKKEYRQDLPQWMPKNITKLPVDERGYPVPWFVAIVDGKPDLRIADGRKLLKAVQKKLCWVCGQPLSPSGFTFVVGPMCAVNRISSEPPSHVKCAEWSAEACPFLIQREKRRRYNDLPEGGIKPPGTMIERQPGVALLWTCHNYKYEIVRTGGRLFHMGDPDSLRWMREGREATREEILESINTGLPALRETCETLQELHALKQATEVALQLVPA
jgi:hypothetical protein